MQFLDRQFQFAGNLAGLLGPLADGLHFLADRAHMFRDVACSGGGLADVAGDFAGRRTLLFNAAAIPPVVILIRSITSRMSEMDETAWLLTDFISSI